MDTTPAPRGWRNPTIMAAIIAAVAVLIVALIGLIPKPQSPATKLPPATTIQQTTAGSGSPAVGKADGNVTIINEQPSTLHK